MKIFKFLILGRLTIGQSVNLFTQNRTPNPEKTQLGKNSIRATNRQHWNKTIDTLSMILGLHV